MLNELITKLQTYSHDGYAIHAIELVSECEHCCSDTVLDNPVLEILVAEDNKSIKLLFKNKS